MNIMALCRDDRAMAQALKVLAEHGPPGAWIGAGFLRNAVWDALSGRAPDIGGLADLDVIFHDQAHPEPAADAAWQARLVQALALPWSVTNQARMHGRNGHARYGDVEDAIAHWPETATAIAVRLQGEVELLAPHGLDDLLAMILRPTPAFALRREVIMERATQKGWFSRWPRLRWA